MLLEESAAPSALVKRAHDGCLAGVLRTELAGIRPRLLVAGALARLLPHHTLSRVRPVLYRLGGLHIGRGSHFFGPVSLWGFGRHPRAAAHRRALACSTRLCGSSWKRRLKLGGQMLLRRPVRLATGASRPGRRGRGLHRGGTVADTVASRFASEDEPARCREAGAPSAVSDLTAVAVPEKATEAMRDLERAGTMRRTLSEAHGTSSASFSSGTAGFTRVRPPGRGRTWSGSESKTSSTRRSSELTDYLHTFE